MRDTVTLLFDGKQVPLRSLGTNDGLNFGRFDAPGLEVHSYELCVSADELVVAMSAEFDALVEEMKVDDLLDDEPSALQLMCYPKLREALHWPEELREVIRIFLEREILIAFVPFSGESDFVINSVDRIFVTESGVTLAGRCFRCRRP